MTLRIHYFNPGHETAILLDEANYTPPTNVQRMIRELALLPAWYADKGDYVFVEELLSPRFISLLPNELRPFGVPISRKELLTKGKKLPAMQAAPWGVSPQSVRFFQLLKETCNLQLDVPEWKEAYLPLTGRQTAAHCLEKIQLLLPDISFPVSPRFCVKEKEIEKYIRLCNAPFVMKTPYSSSGRGLRWLKERKLTEKDRTWIRGAFNKQGTLSIECGVDKAQDLAMEFYSDGQGTVRFEGLSFFSTEENGAYIGNCLESQNSFQQLLVSSIGEENCRRIQEAVTEALREAVGSVYTGYLGVDMILYHDGKGGMKLHPCVEINMRYTMGLLAQRLFERYIHPSSIGDFRITYDSKPGEAYERHRFMKDAYPQHILDGKLKEGYQALCPVTKDTGFRAYMLVM